jgi:hypothetical protein
MKMHQIRSFVAAVVTLVAVVLLAALGSAALGMEIPVLVDIAAAFGVEPAAE